MNTGASPHLECFWGGTLRKYGPPTPINKVDKMIAMVKMPTVTSKEVD